MAVDFKMSETKKNLMRAFVGESQARNRYTFAAAQARTQKQEAVARIFTHTADQEKEHAEIFYNHLKELAGETIFIDGSYPVDITENLGELLQKARHNEFEEHDVLYQAFGDKAKEEGFLKVANSFYMIAEIEKSHGERFGKYAQWIQEGKLHEAEEDRGWICLNCGYIHEGKKAPAVCPVCEHDQGYFVRAEQAPCGM